MKSLATTLLVVLASAVALAAPGDGWLDLDNCSMCKNLTEDAELFESMTWETRLFANGLVEITTVPLAYQERHQRLMVKMQTTGARLQAGEQLPLCGMCMSYGHLMMSGADMDYLTSDGVHVTVISSRDPKVVKMIREHGQRTIDEYAKWMAAEGDDHHGHDHDHHH